MQNCKLPGFSAKTDWWRFVGRRLVIPFCVYLEKFRTMRSINHFYGLFVLFALCGFANQKKEIKRFCRSDHLNPDVIKIYKDFLKQPLSEKSHHLLHTHIIPQEKDFKQKVRSSPDFRIFETWNIKFHWRVC